MITIDRGLQAVINCKGFFIKYWKKQSLFKNYILPN